jgi:hypothetical protein
MVRTVAQLSAGLFGHAFHGDQEGCDEDGTVAALAAPDATTATKTGIVTTPAPSAAYTRFNGFHTSRFDASSLDRRRCRSPFLSRNRHIGGSICWKQEQVGRSRASLWRSSARCDHVK